MFKLLRMFWYKITGKKDKLIDLMSQDADVIAGRYNSAKLKKTKNVKVLRDAVASMAVQQTKGKTRINNLRKQIGDYQMEANGALTLAKRVAAGLTKEQAEANPEYQKHRAAYASKMALVSEKNKELEGEDGNGGLIGTDRALSRDIEGYKSQLLDMARKIGKIDEERDATTAAITAAKEREGIADILSGMSEDSGEKELEEMRSVRERAVARSEIASHMAGTNVQTADAMYRQAGAESAGGGDFDALMNFKDEPAANHEPVKLPEA